MRLNPMILNLIRSPAHHLLPSGLTEISYTGPLSGDSFCLPAQSVVDGPRFLVIAGRPEGKRWWRTFRSTWPARLVRGGRHYEVLGQVLSGPERDIALTVYLTANPSSRRFIDAETPVIAFTPVAS